MNKRGFTLVELLVSLSLLALVISGTFYALGQGMKTWRRVVENCERVQIANLVMERICRDLRAASEVLTTSSPEELVLKVGSDTISYKLVNYKVRRQKGNFTAYLTSEKEVEKLSFAYPEKDLVEVVVGSFRTYAAIRN